MRGNSRATSATASSNSPSVSFWIVYLLAETTCVPRRSARRNAKRAASRLGPRSITRSDTAVSRLTRRPRVLVRAARRDAHDVDVEALLEVGLDARDGRDRPVDDREVEHVAQDRVRALGRRRRGVLDAHAVLLEQSGRVLVDRVAAASRVRLRQVHRHEFEATGERLSSRMDALGQLGGMPSPCSSTTRWVFMVGEAPPRVLSIGRAGLGDAAATR